MPWSAPSPIIGILEGDVDEVLGCNDLVGEMDVLSLLCGDMTPGEAHLLGHPESDDPLQTLRAARPGDDSELDLRLPDFGV